MNKSELIEALASKADLSKVAAGRAVDALLEEIVTAVANGDSVTLVGFGSFKAAPRAAREGKNPKTGEKIMVKAQPAKTVVKVRVMKGLKDMI